MHSRDVPCAQLASAFAPASRRRKKGWLATHMGVGVSYRWRSVRGSPATASTGLRPVIRLWARSCLRSSSDRQVATWLSRIIRWRLRFFRGLTTQTDGSTVTRLHVSRMFRTTWPTLNRVCCSSGANKAHLVDRARLFPANSRRADFKPPLFRLGLNWKKKKATSCFVCARHNVNRAKSRAQRVCLFFHLFFCAARFSLCGPASGVLLA